jgi:predicted GTPase
MSSLYEKYGMSKYGMSMEDYDYIKNIIYTQLDQSISQSIALLEKKTVIQLVTSSITSRYGRYNINNATRIFLNDSNTHLFINDVYEEYIKEVKNRKESPTKNTVAHKRGANTLACNGQIKYTLSEPISRYGPGRETSSSEPRRSRFSIHEPIVTEIEEPNSMVPTDNINICFVGGVSTGKSTILNAIFCEQLTQCKIKRTTMVPTIYIENENNPFQITQPEEIFKQISEKNQELIEKTENGQKITKKEYSELTFNVGKLDINILQDAYVNVYDIPGLNDARTKDIYYEYLEENFHKFNLLIFIVDIHSGLNTSDEIDIVNFITNNTRHQMDKNNKKIYTMVIVNKADDMQLDEDSDETDKLCLTGELNEMYEQVEKTIRTEFERKNISEHLIGIIPLCAIDSYLYRMVKKHGNDFKLSPEQILKIGVNENGKKFSTLKPATQEKKVYEILNDNAFIETMIKLSGFSCLEKTLHKFLNENNTGKTIRIQNLLFTLKKHMDFLVYLSDSNTVFPPNFESLVEKHIDIYQAIKKIDINLYEEFMSNIVAKMFVILQEKVKLYKYDTIDNLINNYEKLNDKILKPYFSEYCDTSDFPAFIKQHIYSLILEHNEHRYQSDIDAFMIELSYLELLHFYNSITINTLICIFIRKPTMAFEYHRVEFVKVLNSFVELDIDISQLLRFVLLHDIKHCAYGNSGDLLFIRKMMYQLHNEIPIQNYILLHFHRIKTLSDEVVIKGINEETLSNEELVVDKYYLDYISRDRITTA